MLAGNKRLPVRHIDAIHAVDIDDGLTGDDVHTVDRSMKSEIATVDNADRDVFSAIIIHPPAHVAIQVVEHIQDVSIVRATGRSTYARMR
jgi:hypothetical protein